MIFDAFLARAATLQWHEIIVAAEDECRRAEEQSYGRKGAVAARAEEARRTRTT
jgi:hypothetical protein